MLPPGSFLGKLPVLLLATQELPSCPLEWGHLCECLSPQQEQGGKGLQQLFSAIWGLSALPLGLNFPGYKMGGFDDYSLVPSYLWPRPKGLLGCEDRLSKDRHN